MTEPARIARTAQEQEQGEGSRMDWQPMESAPKDGPLLGFRMGRWVYPMIVIWLDGDAMPVPGWYSYDNNRRGCLEPTHWMPLPNPPKAEGRS